MLIGSRSDVVAGAIHRVSFVTRWLSVVALASAATVLFLCPTGTIWTLVPVAVLFGWTQIGGL